MSTTEERVKDIYKNYIEIICPYIIQCELLDNEFPIEILNEIRAIFTHLSKYYISDDISIKGKNLSKAESHIKRAILDCYKYLCYAYEDKYKEFEITYKKVDLSLIDNGEFLPKVIEGHKEALALMLDARKSDLVINSDDETNVDDSYKKYESAFNKYSSVYEFINSSYKKLESLRKRFVLKDVFAIGGWIIGIIGILISIIF